VINVRYLYTLGFYLLQPLIAIRLLWRSYRVPAYRQRWLERYGFIHDQITPGGLLIHCVSVGETRAALPLIQALRQTYPQWAITVTTTTPTGSEQVRSLLGYSVYHSYLPYDLPGALNRFLNRLQPRLVILLEKELWPNLLYALQQRQIPVVLANAALSKRSFKGYQRLGRLGRAMMQQLSLVAAQDQASEERFKSLGFPPQRLVLLGNLKFELALAPALKNQAAALKKTWAGQRLVWMAASTHEGEEQIILAAHQQLLTTIPSLLLILAPRHPERFLAIQRLIQRCGLRMITRSSGSTPSTETQVVLADTLGELMLLYGIADLAFVGGSFVEQGGHNPLEPAAHALPILMGPHCFNFTVICQQLKHSGGLTLVQEPTALAAAILPLLTDRNRRQEQGERSLKVFAGNREILPSLLHLLKPYLPPVTLP
jgi:3-deoxy-D-manno-octulosonic-acid transferase